MHDLAMKIYIIFLAVLTLADARHFSPLVISETDTEQPKHGQRRLRRSKQDDDDESPVTPPLRLRPNNNAEAEVKDEGFEPRFDFVVAGFPKCGTTSILKQFFAHDETDMAATEQCAMAAPSLADHIVRRKLDATLSTLSSSPDVKRAFKCPTGMYSYKSIIRMEEHSPNARFIVGMRHPVKMMQSFYNYRITEINEKGLNEPIPSIHEVVASGKPWKGVSLEATRFELFLMQLGKTHVTPEQFKELVGRQYNLAVKPTKFKVFLYTVDQLEDPDEARSKAFRDELQSFLGLKKPIKPFGHENVNHHVSGRSAIKELINICDPEFAEMRHVLTENGKKTAKWLRDELIHSKDIVVANREHFLHTLESWGVDPCETSRTS